MKAQNFVFLGCVYSASLSRRRGIPTWIDFLYLILVGALCLLARLQSHCSKTPDLGRHASVHSQSPTRLSLLFAPHCSTEQLLPKDPCAPPPLDVWPRVHQRQQLPSTISRSHRYPVEDSSGAPCDGFEAVFFTRKGCRVSSTTTKSLSAPHLRVVPRAEGNLAFFSSCSVPDCFSTGPYLHNVGCLRLSSLSRPQHSCGGWSWLQSPPSCYVSLFRSTSGHTGFVPTLLEGSQPRPPVTSQHHGKSKDFRDVRHSAASGRLLATLDADGLFAAADEEPKVDPLQKLQEEGHLRGSGRMLHSAEASEKSFSSCRGEGLLDRRVWARRLSEFGTNVEEVVEQCVKGGGKGGQKVNKTNSCVVIVHLTRGLVIRCQHSRSQRKNRIMARELLLKKLQESIRQQHQQSRDAEEKQRRRNRQPTEAQKARVRAEKQRHSDRKEQRRRISSFDEEMKQEGTLHPWNKET
ncbi:peptidyl-tRNA hydrolase domain-containing protein [Toxoplasma gondii TgCatPRC2]|uniref:Peptidyl-tRNA hydrolase domain-containing protein n=3 Tax=Toxoplasma gondii TaxID=5811 RepID=A0A151H4G2_TOXGO|nr:peptidyl-tRNA hydrolase domain-containing protein [Toxoplasma gondii ME49]EPT29927.1 peptidyl-tRNA hydrolase domain-containing protein [Toxoplasma gondii ME49]KYF44494.1 peptidyl-tRNA hydrolase domain-containing protein [Toxoplasma gondii ARI]KYK64143.1 peptidyl-tRNA hydrolase domain-containing protein [Toxoplasma gondii TgCatPRC2]|eukprot:XP_002367817.2 peptidyl-tRNA hydrolase domain-containing protein [Toxoplasma gondii ME49]